MKPSRFCKIYVFLSLCLITITGYTQEQLTKQRHELPFTIFKTTDSTLNVQDVLKRSSEFIPKENLKDRTRPHVYYWVKVDFKDVIANLASDSTYYITFRNFGYGSMHYEIDGQYKDRGIGRFQNSDPNRSVLYRQGFPFQVTWLIEGRYLLFKVRRVAYFGNPQSWSIYYRNSVGNELTQYYYNSSDLNLLIPVYVFAGICLVILILTLTFYLYSKRLEFLFYVLYVLFLFLYLGSDIFKLHEMLFGEYSLLSYGFFQVCQVVINLCYVIFIMLYLDTKNDYPKLHVALKYIAYVITGIIILDVIFLFTHNFIGHIYILDIQRGIMSVFGLIGMVYLLWKAKDKLAYFIVAGSFLYMVGALGLLFYRDRLYMITGSSLEILIFASGLTYKIQQEYKKRIKFQKESLLNQTKALRAQINPHFIFNALSSIQGFITGNDKVSALKYLSKFSRLTRNILESSLGTNVVLKDEIKMLNDYLELESLRFDRAFQYTITTDSNVDEEALEVPFMIVQPFVENAIIHGLMPKQGSGKQLYINFKKHENMIICTVDDNGVGRQASAKKNHVHQADKQSRGMEVTLKRLQILNQKNPEELIKIIDKTGELGASKGTTVIVKIPLKL